MDNGIYAKVFRKILQPVLVVNKNGKIIDANPSMERMLDVDEGALSGKNIREILTLGSITLFNEHCINSKTTDDKTSNLEMRTLSGRPILRVVNLFTLDRGDQGDLVCLQVIVPEAYKIWNLNEDEYENELHSADEIPGTESDSGKGSGDPLMVQTSPESFDRPLSRNEKALVIERSGGSISQIETKQGPSRKEAEVVSKCEGASLMKIDLIRGNISRLQGMEGSALILKGIMDKPIKVEKGELSALKPELLDDPSASETPEGFTYFIDTRGFILGEIDNHFEIDEGVIKEMLETRKDDAGEGGIQFIWGDFLKDIQQRGFHLATASIQCRSILYGPEKIQLFLITVNQLEKKHTPKVEDEGLIKIQRHGNDKFSIVTADRKVRLLTASEGDVLLGRDFLTLFSSSDRNEVRSLLAGLDPQKTDEHKGELNVEIRRLDGTKLMVRLEIDPKDDRKDDCFSIIEIKINDIAVL